MFVRVFVSYKECPISTIIFLMIMVNCSANCIIEHFDVPSSKFDRVGTYTYVVVSMFILRIIFLKMVLKIYKIPSCNLVFTILWTFYKL